MGMMERADAIKFLAVAEADEEIHKQVQENAILARATQEHVISLQVTDWVTTQQKDPILKTMQSSASLTRKYKI